MNVAVLIDAGSFGHVKTLGDEGSGGECGEGCRRGDVVVRHIARPVGGIEEEERERHGFTFYPLTLSPFFFDAAIRLKRKQNKRGK